MERRGWGSHVERMHVRGGSHLERMHVRGFTHQVSCMVRRRPNTKADRHT